MPDSLAAAPAALLTTVAAPKGANLQDGADMAAAADTAVYRLGLRSMPVLGLPDTLSVGAFRADFVDGPVRAQRTKIRQRPGWPVHFDKHMVREDVGAGERVLLLSLTVPMPSPDEVEAAFLLWRQRAHAAAGALAAVLDERVAGDTLFEDTVLVADGQPISAMDLRERIRNFMPMDVTALDRHALDALDAIELGDGSPVARACRLYRRATGEGPTADAYVALWLAAESLLDTLQPRKVDLDALLLNAGLDPEGLPLHTGLLIRLRGQIVHEGLEDHERLSTAFYEMEAIVRTLIRRAGELRGGWWPAPGPAAFADPWPDALADIGSLHATTWHADGLPAVQPPPSERLPHRILAPDAGLLVSVDDHLRTINDQAADMITNVVVDGLAQLAPDDDRPLRVALHDDHGWRTNGDEILLHPDRLDGIFDAHCPHVLVNFVWDLHAAVGAAVAQREVRSSDDGVAIVEAIASWHQYERLVNHGEFDPTLLNLPDAAGGDPIALGKLAGWAAGGDRHAAAVVAGLGGRSGELGRALVESLVQSPPAPPRPQLP